MHYNMAINPMVVTTDIDIFESLQSCFEATHIMKRSIKVNWNYTKFDHLYRVVADTAEAVHTPAEGADGTASLLIPNIHRLPAGCKRALRLVVVNASEHHLQDK